MFIRHGAAGVAVLILSALPAFAQAPDPGRLIFEARCARCHGADGNGGDMGPAIAQRLTPIDDQQLTKLIHDGQPMKGMPPSVVTDGEIGDLIKFLRTIQRAADRPLARLTGGHSFVNTNDVEAAADSILAEARGYYMLAVADPPVGRKFDLRKLEVKSRRKDVTIRARQLIPGTETPQLAPRRE